MRWLFALIASLAWLGCSEAPPPRNLVLVVLDSARADRLSSYGYPVQTSPNLDALAEEGVLFEATVSNGSWTLPSMTGLFAGDYPTRSIFDNRLKQSLVETIRSAGIRTAAFVEGGFVSERFGFELGFDLFHDAAQVDSNVSIEKTFEDASAWLRENHAERFFVFVHTYEPSTPYSRRDYTDGLDSGKLGERFGPLDASKIRTGQLDFGPTERTWVRALYDGGITASDRNVGRLLETLRQLGIRDQTAVVVTGNHGEDIGGREPEWPGTHGHDLYDESVLVPLIIHDPSHDYPVKRIRSQVRTIDTMHTVVHLLGLSPTEGVLGRTLVPLMNGTEANHRFAWSTVQGSKSFGLPRRFAVRNGTHKLIMTPIERGKIQLELFDLASDPGERVNTAQADTPTRTQLFKALVNLRDGLRRQGQANYRVDRTVDTPDAVPRVREAGDSE
ncbi:MAG: sulfatase [Myxococcota bacterium]|nr:sulfatase [Myxococcota bacterium]